MMTQAMTAATPMNPPLVEQNNAVAGVDLNDRSQGHEPCGIHNGLQKADKTGS